MSGVQSADDVRRQAGPLIRYSDDLLDANRALRRFLYQNVYYHPRVAEVNQNACEMLRRVFQALLTDPEQLGDAAARRIESEGLYRTVCDYVAGMTDRYLIEEHARLIRTNGEPRLSGSALASPASLLRSTAGRSRDRVFFSPNEGREAAVRSGTERYKHESPRPAASCRPHLPIDQPLRLP